MRVAVWRYSTALSLVLVAGVLARPALAHGHLGSGVVRHRHDYHHHHHRADAVAARHFARGRGHRHFAFLEAAAPQARGEPREPFVAMSYDAPVRQARRRVVAASWQASSWQTNSWQSSPQDYWQHGWRGHLRQQASWRQTARQQDNSYAPQSSWSASPGGFGRHAELSGMIAQSASANGVPLSLAERVVRRESGGNPRAMHAGNYGLMQIRLGTARAMGYGGSAAGLLDPSVNMTYAMRYLAGAYHAAGGNESRAVALYARGYHAVPSRARMYTF
jgi:soluble lytic murein transglycosylase-like protein